MKIDGRCRCGEITYEAEVDPDALSLCHCTDCQMISGSAFRANIPAPAPHFVLQSGTPKSYIKTAESGNQRRQVFCGTCGTHLYACAVENPESYMLRAGTITQGAALKPHHQIWRRSALDWVDAIATLTVSDKG
jgi:hypothetical protein